MFVIYYFYLRITSTADLEDKPRSSAVTGGLNLKPITSAVVRSL